ncbi:hypothetical protein NM688_g4265 [Phlebia brevispora]|uniref:Uncharacterized protein n=1 Tax=Phlebia brevispora TaxID=194682 RepID=A0ACC1T349_9APHY|nr:hypothetical protein NM688_g4265 [Phlebia brevispora]
MPSTTSIIEDLPPDISCAETDPPYALASNAVSTISINTYSVGMPPSRCSFTRASGTCNEPLVFKIPYFQRDPEPPARPPSRLPPPGNIFLSLKLGKRVGRGRSGVVYEATIDPTASSSEVNSLIAPPLVVKISRRGHSTDIEHESFYYEEMECLQGVVVPRFYGLFEGETPPGSYFDPTGEGERREPGRDEIDTPDTEEEEHVPAAVSGAVSILVLEQVGGRLPLGEDLPPNTLHEILDVYTHLATLGIDHVDIRYANMRYAPQCPPGWPSLISPYTGLPYRWRLIDFEKAKKTNRRIDAFEVYHQQWVSRILDNLPFGDVVEPWDF